MKTDQEHAEDQGLTCPNCSSSDIEPNGEPTFFVEYMWLPMICNSCRIYYEDHYKIYGYEVKQNENQNLSSS